MRKTMKAAVIDKPGFIKIRDIAIPCPEADEVLIRIEYCGICSTDNMIFNGVYSIDKLPLIPGHEFIGTIEAAGSLVKGWNIGDRVAADINSGCGTCRFCLDNQPMACSAIEQIGIHKDGGFAEFVVVPASKLFHLSGSVDARQYALAEPLSNVVRSIGRCGSLLGRSVAVLGDNFMTLLHLQMVRLAGAWPVTVISNDMTVTNMGLSMGADQSYSFIEIEDEKEVFDIVIETEGTEASYNLAHFLLASGGRLLAFGIPPSGIKASYEPFVTVLKEQSLSSSVAGSGKDILDAISLIESGRLNLLPFVETVIPLEDVAKGLDLMETDKDTFKVLVEVAK